MGKATYIILGTVTKGGKDRDGGNKPAVRLNDEGKTPWATFTVCLFKNQKMRSGEYEDVPYFYKCKVFGKRAEWCKKYLQPSTHVLIFGEPEKYTFRDEDTGEKITVENLIVNSIDFAGAKGAGGGTADDDEAAYQAKAKPEDLDVDDPGPPIDYDNDDPMESPGD